MQLARFLNKVFKKDGFILTDADSKDYIIGKPNKDPIRLKILNKKGIFNIGGKAQTVYQFAKTENKNVKKILSKGELPLKMDMSLKKISKYSK